MLRPGKPESPYPQAHLKPSLGPKKSSQRPVALLISLAFLMSPRIEFSSPRCMLQECPVCHLQCVWAFQIVPSSQASPSPAAPIQACLPFSAVALITGPFWEVVPYLPPPIRSLVSLSLSPELGRNLHGMMKTHLLGILLQLGSFTVYCSFPLLSLMGST